MMDKTKRIFRLYLTLTLLLAVSVIVLKTIAMLSPGFDRANGYYPLHSLPCEIARLATVIGVILLLTQLAPLKGKLEIKNPGRGLPVVFSVALTGILILAFSLFRVLELHLRSLPTRLSNGSISIQAVIFCLASAGEISKSPAGAAPGASAAPAAPQNTTATAANNRFTIPFSIFFPFLLVYRVLD